MYGSRPESVLFVCTGNICRSPIGERILRSLTGAADVGVTVTSAGVGADDGRPMHPSSVAVLTEHGCDAGGFEARHLRPQILDDADLVLTMTREHRSVCQRMRPARWKRMFTLVEFVELRKLLGDDAPLSAFLDSRGLLDTNGDDLDIADPMGQPKPAFDRVFDDIVRPTAEVAIWLGAPDGADLPSSERGGDVPPGDRGGDERSEEPSRDPRHRHRGRWLVPAVVAGLVAVMGAWLAYSAVAAKSELESAKASAQQARTLILAGDEAGAQQAAQSAADDASSAADRTHGIVWSTVAAIPWVGAPLASTTQMSAVVSDYADDVLVPLATLATALSPSALRSGATIDTQPLRHAQPALVSLSRRSREIADQAQMIAPSWLDPVAEARDQLVDVIGSADTTIDGANVAAQLIPPMLGGDRPRNYFLAIQTPSESRGTGGLVGGFGIVNATAGRVTAPTLGANSVYRSPTRPQVDLGDEYDAVYAQYRPYTDFRNSNMSADFGDAARIWIANWKAQTGRQLDGAIAVDPIAMSYVLAVTGPVTLPTGEKISADNIVPITLSTSYQRFADDNEARKAYLQTISRAIIEQVSNVDRDTGSLLRALGRGVHERRIMVYSTEPAEQAILETTNLGHQISDTDAPYFQVLLGNAGGNKLDYYLRRKIRYAAAPCTADTRRSTVTVELTNTLDDLSLPDYVIAPNGTGLEVARGTDLVNVEMLITKGAIPTSLTVDGHSAMRIVRTMHGRPHLATTVQVPPGQTVTVELTLQEPTAARGAAAVPIQPLVDQPGLVVDVPTCG